MIKHAKSPDGYRHVIQPERKGKQERIHGMQNADICLNCTKAKCKGTERCMNRMNREQ